MLLRLLAAALVFGGPSLAQSPRPTPGDVLLLALKPADAAGALTTALSAPDPLVRAAAARVAILTADTALLRATIHALAVERDLAAAEEQARAALIMGGAAALTAIEPHVKRIGGRVWIPVAEWLARHDRPRFIERLPELAAATASLDGGAVRRLVAFVATQPDGHGVRAAWTMIAAEKGWPPAAAEPFGRDDAAPARSVDFWSDGLLQSVAQAARCRLGQNPRLGMAAVGYDSHGRVARIAIDDSQLSKECGTAFRAMIRTTLAEPDRPIDPAQEQWLVLPFSRSFAECTAVRGSDPVMLGASRTGDIEAPKKTRDVRPDYPEAARRAGVQGMVVAEGVISDTGCVRSVRVVRSIQPVLDVSALAAVMQWEFAPARRDGRAIPVLMTVTVSFKLVAR